MGVRIFHVSHTDSEFNVEYNTDDGFEIFKIQLFSLTSVPPDEQKIYGGDDGRLLADDSDLISISEKLRLVSIDHPSQQQQQPEDTAGGSSSSNAERFKSDEELARLLQAEEEALMLQQYVAAPDNGQFEGRIRPYVDRIRMYEDPQRQEAARRTVPEEELEEKALVSLAKEGNFKPSKIEKDHAFLLQLLFWFKRSFSWVNQPPCDGCGHNTAAIGMGDPFPSEAFYGASRVELYRCSTCSKVTRFPRYNDPLKLVETRSGRCGEWANCFTLYCRAFGYESRLILDFTDHVWTECFSPLLGRWMHLDPCEGIYDKPLLYEMGWNKKLNYVIAFSRDGVADVTKRYTRKWHEILSRRVITTEPALSATLSNMTKECRIGLTSQMLTLIEDREKEEKEELERNFHSTAETSILLPGRLSGDEEWRKLRSELGHVKNSSFACFSCPIRLCVDEHVTRIYNAFHPILDGFVKECLCISKSVEVLEILKSLLSNLHKSPFKSRRASMDFNLNTTQYEQYYPSFDELFGVLSLEKRKETNGRFDICLAGDPVITSLALPVVLDTLDEVIYNLKKCEDFGEDSLSLPLLKSNRIHSGSVLASGEELPFGIVTSAFDGSNTSKWEEPNGAKGCWIIYKVPNSRTIELAAYELMSANDAPERDPMDWMVEGSSDGGSSWQTIDQQTSQMFPRRYQRRTFVVSSPSISSNAFRFRFLAARDVHSNSRLQLGSIDLYARSN